jgi:hypothetical protein
MLATTTRSLAPMIRGLMCGAALTSVGVSRFAPAVRPATAPSVAVNSRREISRPLSLPATTHLLRAREGRRQAEGHTRKLAKNVEYTAQGRANV